MQANESADKPVRRYPVFWFAFWLGVLLCQCKIFLLNGFLKTYNIPGGLVYFYNLWMVVQQDVTYAVVLGVIGWAALRSAERHQNVQRVAWTVWLALCLASALCGLANVVIYQQWRRQLTYQVLAYALHSDAGGNLWSSIGAYATPVVVGAVAACFGLYLGAVLLSVRLVRPPGRLNLGPQLLLNLSLLLGAGASSIVAERLYVRHWQWSNRPRALHPNPHWTMLHSVWREARGNQLFQLRAGTGTTDLSDFQTLSERPPGPSLELPASVRPKNMILVVMESTAARYMSVYGAPYNSTPYLKEEAKHSLIFDNFYSHDVASATSLFTFVTSKYPRLSWDVMTSGGVPANAMTLPQALRAADCRSAFITSADLSWANERAFLDGCGFDAVRDYRDLGAPKLNTWGAEDRYLIDGILKFIEEAQGRSFAVVAWTNQTHHPYTLVPGQQEMQFVAGESGLSKELNEYLNCLHESDRQLGRLFEELRKRRLADDTLVVITGDHGEAFLDPHPIKGHGNDLYEECVKVPGIFWNPRLFPTGRRNQTLGGHIDLAPTILDFLGLAKSPTWQGRSLFDVERSGRVYFFSQLDFGLGVREGDWKLIYRETDERLELYNLRIDTTEQNNIVSQNPLIRQSLLHRLEGWVSSDQRYGVPPKPLQNAPSTITP